MSNFPDAHKVYDLAAVFRERVIEQGRSFLWPDQEIWTVDNATAAYEWFLQNLDPKTFTVDTLADKAAEHSIATVMIAADVYAVSQLTAWYDVRLVRQRLDQYFSAEGVPAPDPIQFEELLNTLKTQVPASKFHYSGYWPQRIATNIGILTDLLASKEEIDDSYESVFDLVQVRIQSNPHKFERGAMDLLQLLYSDRMPLTAGKADTRAIINNFQVHLDELSGPSDFSEMRTVCDNEKLVRIHAALVPNSSYYEAGFYAPQLMAEWESNPRKSERVLRNMWGESEPLDAKPVGHVSHIVAEKPKVYEIARMFDDRVIKRRSSLLWPDEEIWTDEAIEQFYVDFQAMPVIKGNSWLQNYEAKLQNGNQSSARILADSYAFLMQFPSLDTFKASSKSNDLQRMLGWTSEFAPNQTDLASVVEAFGVGVGSPGMFFSAHIQYQLAFVPGFVYEYRNHPESGLLIAAATTADRLKRDYGFKRSVVPAQNIVLHLLDPSGYERIASRADKMKIVDTFDSLADDPEFDLDEELDLQLRRVRSYLAPMYFASDFDFYDANVQLYWNSETPPPWPPQKDGPHLTDLAAATHLEESYLREIEDLLHDKKQLIFEGPPGSGKTFVAEKFARYFTDQEIDDENRNDQIEIIQFHQSYSYEDFVEGIRPQTIEGQLHYNVVPGIFRRFADTAARNPDKKFVLIIDEINRGNVSRILGELMLLLEYRDKSATLQYSQEALTIPPNLYIIGTMNSADRSLSQIDYALRRRFYFVRFMSVENGKADVLSRWLDKTSDDSDANRGAVQAFVHLNTKLSARLGTDDLQVGHSYFMRADIHEPAAQEMVWKYAVMPLLREYLYHDRERDKVLATFSLDAIRAELAPLVPDPDTSASVEGIEDESE